MSEQIDVLEDSAQPQVIEHTEEIMKAIADTAKPTRERLVDALIEDKMPIWMINNARLGDYDFDGRTKLLKALSARNNTELIKRIADGEFNHDLRDMQALFAKAQREGRPMTQQNQAQKSPARRQRRANASIYKRTLKKSKGA